MEGKFCSNCNQRLDGNAYICKYCGSVNGSKEESVAKSAEGKRLGKGGLWLIIALIIVVIIAIVMVVK